MKVNIIHSSRSKKIRPTIRHEKGETQDKLYSGAGADDQRSCWALANEQLFKMHCGIKYTSGFKGFIWRKIIKYLLKYIFLYWLHVKIFCVILLAILKYFLNIYTRKQYIMHVVNIIFGQCWYKQRKKMYFSTFVIKESLIEVKLEKDDVMDAWDIGKESYFWESFTVLENYIQAYVGIWIFREVYLPVR